jgi:hypothetical protein
MDISIKKESLLQGLEKTQHREYYLEMSFGLEMS